MNRITLLMPDCLVNPMGGMGEQARQFVNTFDKRYQNFHFEVVGTNRQQYTRGNNYTFNPVQSIFTNNATPINEMVDGIVGQIPLLSKGISVGKPDIVHSFDWSTLLAGIELSKYWGVPLVTTIQLSPSKMLNQMGAKPEDDEKILFEFLVSLETMGLMQSDTIIQTSEEYCKLFPFPLLQKTYVIENAINLSEWSSFKKVQLPGNRKNKVVYIGRSDFMKNVHTLLALDLPKEVDLIFITHRHGGAKEIYNSVKEIDREGFHFVGPKYQQERTDWLCSADAVIVPSIHEPFGIVALEALASKSILLSSFRGGMGEFLNEDAAINCGITKASIEESLNYFVNMSKEENERRVREGLKICHNLSCENQVEKMHFVYNELLDKTRSK